jgi:DNA-binding IclR family transcriptional regulator
LFTFDVDFHMSDTDQRYKAPALEKGLDILELVAAEANPITVAEITRRLDRSHGELFRMLQVLEFRGFIERAPDSDGYRLTDKLFALGLGQPRIKGLVETALPKMLALAEATGQSCHLAVHSEGQIVVVARMESSEMIGFSVRVGHRRALAGTVSGTVLYAFQAAQVRQRWDRWLAEQLDAAARPDFERRVLKAHKNGWASAKSGYAACITDLAAPVWRGESAAAALAIPFVESTRQMLSMDDTIVMLKACADDISTHLVASDARL